MSLIDGKRALIVEDEPLLALELEDLLKKLGCSVAGKAAQLEAALALATELDFDVAVLDVNLGSARIDTAAEIIARRNIPIVFTTGYGETGRGLVAGYQVVAKPYTASSLKAALERVLDQG